MMMEPVRSSAILAIGYSPVGQALKIQFKGGDTYDFVGVPAHIHDAFMKASSKGSYYDAHIRGRYQR